jgi:CRISPR-associated protein Csm2
MALLTIQEIEQVIRHSDDKALVEAAEKVGKALASTHRLTTSQIRGIFGTVRQIEMDWLHSSQGATDDADRADRERHAKRELLLLKPRIAYQAQRERGQGVKELRDVLTPAIDMIEGDKDRFQNFVDFFEAILAYHRANGGSNS